MLLSAGVSETIQFQMFVIHRAPLHVPKRYLQHLSVISGLNEDTAKAQEQIKPGHVCSMTEHCKTPADTVL